VSGGSHITGSWREELTSPSFCTTTNGRVYISNYDSFPTCCEICGLTLRTEKTGTHVCVPLPPAAIEALAAIQTDKLYFWSGRGLKKSCVGDYQRAFKKFYTLAKVDSGHAHRWRDTFAVELLLARIPLERVPVLLGHKSIKVTERHYSPWVKARQDQLEADVRSTFRAANLATNKTQTSNSQ
jgi:integrase